MDPLQFVRLGGGPWDGQRVQVEGDTEVLRVSGDISAFDALEEVGTPVLLIGTERDRLVDTRAIRTAAARLPKAELLMFNDAAHEILRETDKVRLEALARIDGFLDAHAPAG